MTHLCSYPQTQLIAICESHSNVYLEHYMVYVCVGCSSSIKGQLCVIYNSGMIYFQFKL